MRRLLPYLTKYRTQTILAPLFKMLEVVLSLLTPLVVADIINNGIANGDRGYIISRVWMLVGLAALGFAMAVVAQRFSAAASSGFAAELRQACYDHIQRFSYADLDRQGASSLITRLTDDINQVQTGLNLALRLLLRSPLVVLGSMVMAFTIDVKCALIFLAAIPLLFAVVYAIMRISIPLFEKSQRQLDQLTNLTRENLTGARVIRAFCREKDFAGEFDRENAALTRLNEFVGRLSALMNPATYVLINLAAILLIRQGAEQVNTGAIAQGDVVALYNYMAQITIELIKLASLLITINKSLACADRVAEILHVQPSMTFAEKAIAASALSDEAIRFDHVTFTYDGAGAPSLQDVDFTARRGQTIGVIGGTGSGKSTLIDLIARFYDASEGAVYMDGRNVKEYPQDSLTEKIGIVPQKAVLFKGTIRENLLWGKKDAAEDDLWHALEVAQAKEIVEGKGGLDAPVDQLGRNFSGGQRQRLTIARALVKHPEILILDDSASALDFATDAALRRAIRAESAGKMTTFLISQRTATLRQADLILVLDDGRVIGQGTHDRLMQTCEEYREIYYSQFPEERPSTQKSPAHKEGVMA